MSGDAWEALCVDRFQSCQVDWAPRSFHAEMSSSTRLLSVSLTRLASDGFGVSRTFAHTRCNDADEIMIVLHHSSQQGKLEHNGHKSVIQGGGAVLIDTARPYSFDFAGPVDQTVIKLPRSSAGLGARSAGQAIGIDGSAGLRVLASILRELERIDSEIATQEVGSLADSPYILRTLMGEADALTNAAVEMATLSFARLPASVSNAGQEVLLAAAQEFVRVRLWDPRLGPEAIATHIGSSVRFVSQLFATQGTSPAAFIRDTRLDKAKDLLLSAERQNTAIFDIALRVGFVDATTFTRAFKRKFGAAPSDLRKGPTLG
jgi:AraC-like DNA-binding protein